MSNINPRSPAYNAAAVTPSDTVPLSIVARGLYIGAAGNVAVLTTGGDTVTFVAAPTGTVLPISVQKVLATGTTATSIVALL